MAQSPAPTIVSSTEAAIAPREGTKIADVGAALAP
jgi:hypothetical protein